MKIAITHSTTACVLLEIGSIRILTDPVFDAGEKHYTLGPAAHATRYIGPAIDPATIPPLNAVLLSHAHHLDNLDSSGEAFLQQASCVITGRHDSQRAGAKATRLSVWESTTITGADGFCIKITATPACHGPWWLPQSYHVVGFVLEWPGQEHGTLYISGDTVFFHGMHRIGRNFNIGTALLHLGAVHFWPPWPSCLRFSMTGAQGAKCVRALRLGKTKPIQTVIPIHYEQSVWSHFRESRESYENAFADAGLSSRLRWLRPGERTIIDT